MRIATGHADAHAQTTGVEHRSTRGGLAPWQIRLTEQILTERLNEAVSLAYLAGECRLSVAHFARAFKRSFGEPPHHYLNGRRIERAKTLLENPARSVTEIALAVGFADPVSFAAAFHRLAGTTPTKYRRGLR